MIHCCTNKISPVLDGSIRSRAPKTCPRRRKGNTFHGPYLIVLFLQIHKPIMFCSIQNIGVTYDSQKPICLNYVRPGLEQNALEKSVFLVVENNGSLGRGFTWKFSFFKCTVIPLLGKAPMCIVGQGSNVHC